MSLIRDPRPATGLRRDDGVTLFELLVVMTIFIGVMAVCFQVLGAVQQQTGDNLSQTEAVQSARLGLANIDRQLRSAESVIPATTTGSTNLRAYVQADGNPRCIEYDVQATGELRTRSWTSTTGVTPWRTIATRLANTSSTAPFKVTAPPTATPSASVQRTLVDVTLLVKPSSGAKPVEVTTSLTVRNQPATATTLCATAPAP